MTPTAAIALPAARLTRDTYARAVPHAPPMRSRSIAVPAWDEDALTLACRAARALGPPAGVRRVVLAFGEECDTPEVGLHHLGLADAALTTLSGRHAGTEAMALASEGTLVLAGTAPRSAAGAEGSADVGAIGVAVAGPAAAADPPPDLLDVVGRVDAVAAVVGAALATKTPVLRSAPPATEIPYAGVVARRHRLEVVPPWQEAPQGAHVSPTEWAADGPARYRLFVARCRTCGRVAYPPRTPAPCGHEDGERLDLPMEGVVAARTRIHPAGAPGEFAAQARAVGPYGVVVVEHEAGLRVIGQLAGDAPEAATGDRVVGELRVLFRQMGTTRYALKWRPA